MRSHANRGQPFEEFLAFVHAKYQAKGIACVHKVPTEFIPLRNGRGQVSGAKVENKSCVDYLGRYRSTPVAVEAKHTEDTRISFSRVEPHQADYMDDFCKDDGAIGIVLVSFSLNRFFAVPWPFWKAARDAWIAGKGKTKIPVEAYGWKWETTGMASTTAEQLHPDWEIKSGGATGLPYLDIIKRMKGEHDEHGHS